MDLELAGRHVVVFGGTSGINLGIAKAFARERAKVTVVSRKPENVEGATAQQRARAVIPCDGGGAVESVKPALDAAAALA